MFQYIKCFVGRGMQIRTSLLFVTHVTTVTSCLWLFVGLDLIVIKIEHKMCFFVFVCFFLKYYPNIFYFSRVGFAPLKNQRLNLTALNPAPQC